MSQTPSDQPREPELPPTTPPPAEPPPAEPGPSIDVPPAAPEPTPADPMDFPGPDGTGRRGRGRGLGLALAGLAVVAVVLVGGWLLLRDDDESASPEEAVRSFFDASKEQDCDRLVELVVESSWSQNGTVSRDTAIRQCKEDLRDQPEIDATLHEVEVTSEKKDSAVVAVNYTVDDEEVDTELDLVKEDGDWKIDAI